MSDEMSRIAELEAEIDLLRRSTSEALEKSWEEMERLHREAEESHLHGMTLSMHHRGRRNSYSRNCLTSLQFDNKMPNTSGNIPDIMSIVTDDTVSSSLADDNLQNWSLGNSLRNLGVVGSWRGAKRQAAVQTQIEKDLMRQLEVMQNDKISTEEDLMLKIRQRESAIETLEGMVVIQDQTIQNLRNEMEEMKKRHEIETKAKSRKEDKKQMSLRRLDSTEQEGKFSSGLAKSSARPDPDDSISENSVGSLQRSHRPIHHFQIPGETRDVSKQVVMSAANVPLQAEQRKTSHSSPAVGAADIWKWTTLIEGIENSRYATAEDDLLNAQVESPKTMLLRSEGEEADPMRALLAVGVLKLASTLRSNRGDFLADPVTSVLQPLGADATHMETMEQRFLSQLNSQLSLKAFQFHSQGPEAKFHL